MVKTYQLRKPGSFGSSIKVAPVTTEEELNVNECLLVNGTRDLSIDIQSILPELTGFECIGQELINGIMTEKWQLKQEVGLKLNKYTMWLRFKNDPQYPKIKYAIPMR